MFHGTQFRLREVGGDAKRMVHVGVRGIEIGIYCEEEVDVSKRAPRDLSIQMQAACKSCNFEAAAARDRHAHMHEICSSRQVFHAHEGERSHASLGSIVQ